MLQLKTDLEMPCSHAAELAALSLMLLHDDCRSVGMTHLKESDFHFGSSKIFFRVLHQAVEERAVISEWTIYERILAATEPRLHGDMGADWLDVLQICDYPNHLADHIATLVDKATRRALHLLASRVKDEAVIGGEMPELSSRQLIDSAEERLRALRRDAPDATEADIRDLFDQFEDDMAGDAPTASRSVRIGIDSIDAANRGPFGGELVVIAARPSVGKTAFGLQAAIRAASDDSPSYIFSLEMTKRQIQERAIANISGISVNRLRERQFDEEDSNNYLFAREKFMGTCRVNFARGVSVGDIANAARTAHRVLGIRLLMVDYLGMIRKNSPQGEKDYEAMGRITSELKHLALELGIPILLLAQLNRESEKDGREPRLSDLAQSGRIEQDADQVWALHAPDGIGQPARLLTVLKGRNTGAGLRVNLEFLTDTQRIREKA